MWMRVSHLVQATATGHTSIVSGESSAWRPGTHLPAAEQMADVPAQGLGVKGSGDHLRGPRTATWRC